MTLGILMWVVTAISVVGATLNAKRLKSGFYFFLVANVAWVCYDLHIGSYAQAGLFVVLAGLSVYGIITWTKKEREKRGG